VYHTFILDLGNGQICGCCLPTVYYYYRKEAVGALRTPLAHLYRATRNACLSPGRDRQRETGLQLTESWFVHPGGNQDEVLNLQQPLRELPEEQRETVFLKVWGGMTLLEISEMALQPATPFLLTLYM